LGGTPGTPAVPQATEHPGVKPNPNPDPNPNPHGNDYPQGIKWRLVVAEWEKGPALIPMETVLDVVGNVYNTNTPR
jgi:hypothetical protein